MINENVVEIFESRVKKNLEDMGFSVESLGGNDCCVACGVSGGADSIALFVCLCRLLFSIGVQVKAVSVDHKIRSAEESGGDADFVRSVADTLKAEGYKCSCSVVCLEEGQVFKSAENRGNGIEEAARFLRYGVFEDFIKENSPVFFALAHNKNDQIETVLMRFLQGSGCAGLGGISCRRGIFVRPLLNVSREDIETYLKALGISWRTDSTNFDVQYLRNRIRHRLIPFLKENFPGFEKSLVSGSEKAVLERACIESLVPFDFWSLSESSEGAKALLSDFLAVSEAVQVRLLYKAFDLIGGAGRFPFSAIKVFLSDIKVDSSSANVFVGGVELSVEDCFVCVKKKRLVATESSFFAIIKESGNFSFPLFDVVVKVASGNAQVNIESDLDSVVLESVPVPFCIRSRQCGDEIKNSWGGYRSLSDVYSDWHASGSEIRNSIPVIQELSSPEQNIIAACGSVLGFKNWIVRDYVLEGKNE